MRVVLMLLSIVFALAGCGNGREDIVTVQKGDPEMMAAIQQARDTVDEFITDLQNPKPGQDSFAVKMYLPGVNNAENGEHIWVGDVTYANGLFTGKLINEPENPAYKLGQEVSVKREEISDWIIFEGESMRGGYTQAVLESRG